MLAWIVILLAGFSTVIGLMQAAVVTFVVPNGAFWANEAVPRGIEKLPSVARLLLSNVQLFFVAYWLLSIVAFISAIGLLMRKNWARFVLVALFALGIVWNIGGLWIQSQMVEFMRQPPAHAQADFAAQMEIGIWIMRIGSYAIAITMTVLFGWLIKRLLSAPSTEEFNAL